MARPCNASWRAAWFMDLAAREWPEDHAAVTKTDPRPPGFMSASNRMRHRYEGALAIRECDEESAQ